MTLLVLGLINWIVTTIIVEGVIFDEQRAWAKQHLPAKIAYLTTCHLCAGTWVGWAVAVAAGFRVGHGIVGLALGGLAIKAVGHITLELASVLKNINQRLSLRRLDDNMGREHWVSR